MPEWLTTGALVGSIIWNILQVLDRQAKRRQASSDHDDDIVAKEEIKRQKELENDRRHAEHEKEMAIMKVEFRGVTNELARTNQLLQEFIRLMKLEKQ
jgi:hypothetical protein